jgi:hypothetical protein
MPSDCDIKQTIQKNTEEICRLSARITATFSTRSQSQEDRNAWEAACAEFHQRYDQLAFPGGYVGALDRILAGDHQTIQAALCFVESRPYFFRSGYMFKDLFRKLKRAPMNVVNAKRLEMVLTTYTNYRNQRRRHASQA